MFNQCLTKSVKIIFNYHHVNRLMLLISDPGGTRTPNRQNRNLLFYPIELRSQKAANLVNILGFIDIVLDLKIKSNLSLFSLAKSYKMHL
jgi:hypothetical protein